MALDSSNAGQVDQGGPAAQDGKVVATEDRLYEVAPQSRVLIRHGDAVPRRLQGLGYYPAVVVDGVFVPKPKERKRG